MHKHFARTVLTGFLIAMLVFGGINMVSAAGKPTPTPRPVPLLHRRLPRRSRSLAPGIAATIFVTGVSFAIRHLEANLTPPITG